MRFSRFDFENFKGIETASLTLDGQGAAQRVATLVGLNESGKTTILEAIDRFVPGAESEEIGPKHIGDWRPSEPFELIPISKRANFNHPISLIATLALDAEDKVAISREVTKKTGFRIDTMPDEVKITNRYIFINSEFKQSVTLWPQVLGTGRTVRGRVLTNISSTKTSARPVWQATIAAIRDRVPAVWYFPNFLFDFPDHIDLTPGPDETPRNKLYRSLFQDILDSVAPGLETRTHVVDRALSTEDGAAKSLRQLRLDIGREVTKSVVRAWNTLFGNDELDGKRVILEIEAPTASEVTARFELEDADGVFAIKERSLGFRWFFVYLLLTTYRGRRTGPASDVMFLFDEPASNLHSSAQETLLQSLETLSSSASIIYTTHSQHLINPLWLGSTFVVSNEGLDVAKISSQRSSFTNIKVEGYSSFANRNPSRSHYFQPVLDVLQYQPSKLELVPEVVMTEGKSDYYVLRYAQEVLLASSSRGALHFLPGTGSGSLDLPIQLYSAWARNFLVLLDSDVSGKGARDRYLQKFGSALEGRVTTLGDEVVEAKALESLFSPKDRLTLEKLVSPEQKQSTKKGFARGVEHALATRTVIELDDRTRKNLGDLLDGLRSRMESVRGQPLKM